MLPGFRRNALLRLWQATPRLSVHNRLQLRNYHIDAQGFRQAQFPRTPRTFGRCIRRNTTPRSHSVRHNSSKPSPNPTPNLGSPDPPLSFSQRMKKLSREYGWSALGVYLALTALDFPFCFLAVRSLGTERIGHWEHVVVESFWKVVAIPFPNLRGTVNEKQAEVEESPTLGELAAREGGGGWGVEEAEIKNQGDNASIWTQLALAYAIHKSFIFIRVPITAAITPKVVKTLRGWGWNIGKRRPKPSTKA
ncbi:MAG: hypothetical protein M1820_004301 [Bogoriella megaspora]|nr:MAG: hypothetical protein M1820_004301 [Bogoriella megaspora]